MNLIARECPNGKADSAFYLLKKYAGNRRSGEDLTVSFLEDKNCRGDDYRIEVSTTKISIYGNTAVAFNAAVGYLIRNQHGTIESRNVTFYSDFRAVYFANHFYNYYHAAPIEEICEYLESLALWGQSALCLWFDMHHFQSISAPQADRMLDRMIQIFQKAKSLGMKTSLTRLPNEYYADANKKLLAQNRTEDGRYTRKLCGFYYTELCPSKQEAEALLLASFEELMHRFSSVGLDYIMLWPYDQGGCTCKQCYPWGANGFYKLAKKQAAIAKKYFPDIEIILSCWRFDHFTQGEWAAVLPLIREDGNWLDRLMVDITAPLPEELPSLGKPVVSFPEISMYHATPWGGFGANPFPNTLGAQFRKTKSFCRGGALYSEGIFEDINKAVALELMRDPSIPPAQIVFEYCAYHFGPEYAHELTDIILRLEDTLRRATYLANGEKCAFPSEKPSALHTYVIRNADPVEGIAHDFSEIDKKLPESVRKSLRYQLIYIRVFGDAALVRNGGIPSDESDALFARLVELYHAENAYYFVSPVTRDSIMQNRGEGI